MCDGCTKRTLCRFFRVHVNPLMVSGGISKLVDALLAYCLPVAVTQMLSDRVQQCGRIVKQCCHNVHLFIAQVTGTIPSPSRASGISA